MHGNTHVSQKTSATLCGCAKQRLIDLAQSKHLHRPAPGRGRPPSPRARSALGTSAKAKPNPAAAPAPASADGAEAGTPDPGFRSPASKLIPNPFPAHHFEQISRAVRVKVLDLDRRVRSVEKLAKIRNHAQDIAALMRADEVASVGAVAMAGIQTFLVTLQRLADFGKMGNA